MLINKPKVRDFLIHQLEMGLFRSCLIGLDLCHGKQTHKVLGILTNASDFDRFQMAILTGILDLALVFSCLLKTLKKFYILV